MKYCINCGSELRGAKKFCMVCGTEQEKAKKDKIEKRVERPKMEKGEEEMSTCVKCGEDTDKKCYFCSDFICREHYIRLQANTNSYVEMQRFLNEGDTKSINEGWRGLIVFSCPKCTRLKVGKQLTDDEILAINTVDDCSWYKLDSQL